MVKFVLKSLTLPARVPSGFAFFLTLGFENARGDRKFEKIAYALYGWLIN